MSDGHSHSNSNAVLELRKKLEALRVAHAVIVDAATKFGIERQIEETEESLQKLLRAGVQSDELGFDKIDEELIRELFNQCSKYDSQYSKHADGDFNAIENFLVRYALAYRSSRGAAALTDAGIILCCQADFIPASRIHTQTEIRIADQTSILDGSLLHLRREILQRLAFLWKTATSSPNIRDDDGNEVAFYDVPEIAVIEAVTNALIHRDYEEDDKAWITVADDRIEIVNPGKSKTPISDLLERASHDLHPKYERNPRIIDVTTLARLNNARGSGINRIRQALERNGTLRDGKQPALELRNDEANNRFHLVIYRRNISTLTRPPPPKPDGVFISCVSDEFEKDGAPFPGLRGQLRGYLARTRSNVRVQEDFPQTAVDTIKKLDTEIRPRAAVIHLVGEKPGAIATPAAVAEYLKDEPGFLASHPELRAALGDFSGVSYTQWEALIALHHNVPLLVYATDKAYAQKTYLDRLALGLRYAMRIASDTDLFVQLIGDLHEILPAIPQFTRKIFSRQLAKHAPKVLFGRETELAALDAAWANGMLNIYTLVAWGGAGKTSLAFHWVQTRFAAKKSWPGVERYFDWSFYSQGTGESRQTSADLFIAGALEFFGDPDPTQGGPNERGERLAGLVRQHRTLLILDGIEPLQYPPGDPQAGRLKDPALEALLRELAGDNPGLVVITTREHLGNLEAYATAEEHRLDKLSPEAAVALLRHLQIVGTDEELHAAWRHAGGHALTLSLLGRFIADAYEDRDIRHYREVKFEAADEEHQGRSAFKVMVAYERWLGSGGPERQRELAVLRLTGLFERPMAKSSLQALRAEPAIAGLTDTLVKLTPQQWNIAVKRLSEAELLAVSPDAIDAHPLVREYFAAQLKREQPEAFQAAHSRLFDYLCENTPHRPDGLDGLAPLYEAVTHGCLAGRQQEACEKVYVDRILRGTGNDGFYSLRKLGAIGADLAAVAAFFDEPWSQVSTSLTVAAQALLLNEAAIHLRALGRLTEALQPMRAGLEMAARQQDRTNAAVRASNLSELEQMLGRLPDAVADARQAVTHADQSGHAFQRMAARTTAADALHQSGQRAEAGALFAEAERMQQERQPQFDLLYSLWGVRYCDWLLAPAEQAAWQHWLDQPLSVSKSQLSKGLAEIECRTTITLKWTIENDMSLLDIALDHLTLARFGLIRAMLEGYPTNPQQPLDLPHVAAAVNGLRAAGMLDYLPRGLLTAALYHFVRGEPALAHKHLAEAQQIAERGPMPLFLADVHLTRARLFRDRDELSKAAHLIRTHGYGRRTEELATAEMALA